MTILFHLCYPAADLLALCWLVRRILWRRYPALMSYLLIEIVTSTLSTVGIWTSSQPLRMAVRLWVVFEVFSFSCLPLSVKERWSFTSVSCGLSSVLMFRSSSGLDALQIFILFRQYFHVILAAVLILLMIFRKDLIENAEHRAYRIGVTCIILRIAVTSSFIRNGLAYKIFPFKDWVYSGADIIGWILGPVMILALAWQMGKSYSAQVRNMRKI